MKLNVNGKNVPKDQIHHKNVNTNLINGPTKKGSNRPVLGELVCKGLLKENSAQIRATVELNSGIAVRKRSRVVEPVSPQEHSFTVYEDCDDEAARSEFPQTATNALRQLEGSGYDSCTGDISFQSLMGTSKLTQDSLLPVERTALSDISALAIDFSDQFESCQGTSSPAVSTASSYCPAKQEVGAEFYPVFMDDTFKYLIHLDERDALDINFMGNQSEINHEMRAVLVEWLIEIASDFQLEHDTLHYAISLVDRMIQNLDIPSNKFQLVGGTCLFILNKYEEEKPKEMKDFVYMSDTCFDGDEVVKMERVIMRTVDFKIITPTALAFIDFICHKLGYGEVHYQLCLFAADISLLAGGLGVGRKLVVGAACVAYANSCLNREAWSGQLEELCNVKKVDVMSLLKDIAAQISSLMHGPQENKIVKMYRDAKRCYAADYPVPPCLLNNREP
uniref:Cyclin N-terminal domain-containing protein n=1 Tax=Rhabditophanes sp. KR3021 TaxID=114890 RepID=A0AC35UCS1_9BILA